MEMYLTFDDSTQKQELLRCSSEIYFSLTTVHFLHTRSTTFKLLPILSPDLHAVSEWRSVWRKQRWFISQSQEQTTQLQPSQSTTTHWKSLRIGKASGSFGKLTKRLWSERGVRLVTNINVYCAVVLPTLLYGMGVRHGHHTADTYGDSTSSTCVA